MNSDTVLRTIKDGDEESVTNILQIGFDRWPYFDVDSSPLDHWKWKYQDNPLKNNVIIIVERNNEIVGVGSSFLCNIHVGNQDLLSAHLGDTVVHPDMRRKGLMHKIRIMINENSKKEGVQLAFFSSTNPIVVESLSKMYNVFPFTIIDMIKIKDVNLHLQMHSIKDAWLKKLGYYASSFIGKMETLISNIPAVGQQIQIREVSSFDIRFDEFWDEVRGYYKFIIERNRDQLNWRYCDPRAGKHVVMQAEQGGRVLGYIVLRINRYREDYPFGHIVDLLTLPDRHDVAEALVEMVLRCFTGEGVNVIELKVVKGHPFEEVYKRHGFIDSRKKTNVLHYPLVGEDEILKQKNTLPQKIHFAYADM